MEPGEYVVVCEALQPYKERLRSELRQAARAVNADPGRRLRAACALARYDPEDCGWADLAPFVAERLVAENPLHIASWLEALLPVRDRLLGPLADFCKSAQLADTERAQATAILADCAAGQTGILTDVLADVLLEGTAKQFALLWPTIQAQRERAIKIFRAELGRQQSAENRFEARDALARRQAQSAVALLNLGEAEPVWPLLRPSPDPARRTYLVHAFGPLGTPPDVLIRALESESDAGVRRALILGLGEFTREQLPDDRREPLVRTLLGWYRNDPDPGVHGAIDWLLRDGRQRKSPRKLYWGQGEALAKIDHELAGLPANTRNWYVSRDGLTFAVISGPERFRMGSPEDEKDRRKDETAHLRRISRRFALATKPVTVKQFAEFQRESPSITDIATGAYSPDEECPQTRVTWFEAAAYCNWLSQREGIPRDQWCYALRNPYTTGTTATANYLSLSGYRLPTEAEWEYSCRAGSSASRYFGDSDELLGLYAWFNQNADARTWPVGSLKPNDYGLFDLLGNVQEWCQDRFRDYPSAGTGEPVEDIEDSQDAMETFGGDRRVLRGGSFIIFAGLVRSADRDSSRPDDRHNYFGFRPARTFTAVPARL